jgi:hypothetical protein
MRQPSGFSRRFSESAMTILFPPTSPKRRASREPIVINNSQSIGGLPGRAKLGLVVQGGTGIHSLLLALQSSIHDSVHCTNTALTDGPEIKEYAYARKVRP